jgi:hypothetical protein
VIERPEKIWRLTGIYGEPRWEDKYKTWDKLQELNNNLDLPWVVIGNFNEILFSHEKEGGNPRPQPYMQNFREALMDCNLKTLDLWGPFHLEERTDERASGHGRGQR